MKKLFLLIAVGAVAFFGWQHYNANAVTDPTFVELRAKHVKSGIELVGFGRMNSERDCERRADVFWRRVLTSDSDFELVVATCAHEIEPRYEKLFNNETIQATYLAMDRGKSGERDGRFIIYGAPSSEVAKVCPQIIARIKRTYSGQVQCVQGTVG